MLMEIDRSCLVSVLPSSSRRTRLPLYRSHVRSSIVRRPQYLVAQSGSICIEFTFGWLYLHSFLPNVPAEFPTPRSRLHLVAPISKLPRNRAKSQLPQQAAAPQTSNFITYHGIYYGGITFQPCQNAISPGALTPFYLPCTFPGFLPDNPFFIQLYISLHIFPSPQAYNLVSHTIHSIYRNKVSTNRSRPIT